MKNKFTCIYFIIFVPILVFITMVEYFVVNNSADNGVDIEKNSIFNIDSVYKKIITAGPRIPEQNYTVLVDFGISNYSIPRHGVCGGDGQRKIIADVVENVSRLSPSVIAIDKVFSTDCGNDDGTKYLINKLRGVSEKIPIVVAAEIDTEKPIKYKGKNTYRVMKSIIFPNNNEQKIFEGITNSDPDNRKVSLKWYLIKDSVSYIEEYNSFSFAIVDQFYKGNNYLDRNYQKLKLLSSLSRRVNISFIEKSNLKTFNVDQIIDKNFFNNDNIRSLTPHFSGKVVIIGESSRDFDNHQTPVGVVSGMIIEANYIESLIDQRYYNQFFWVDLVFGLAITVIIFLLGHNICSTVKFVLYLSVMLCIFCIFFYVIVCLFGIYINPVTMSVVSIVANLLHRLVPIGGDRHGKKYKMDGMLHVK